MVATLAAVAIVSVGLYVFLDTPQPDASGTGGVGQAPGPGGLSPSRLQTQTLPQSPDTAGFRATGDESGRAAPVNSMVLDKCVTVEDSEGNMEANCKRLPAADPRLLLSPFG